MCERQSEMFVCWDEIRGQVVRVRDLLTAHHKLISDVRLLLKAIAKVRETGEGRQGGSKGVGDDEHLPRSERRGRDERERAKGWHELSVPGHVRTLNIRR